MSHLAFPLIHNFSHIGRYITFLWVGVENLGALAYSPLVALWTWVWILYLSTSFLPSSSCRLDLCLSHQNPKPPAREIQTSRLRRVEGQNAAMQHQM